MEDVRSWMWRWSTRMMAWVEGGVEILNSDWSSPHRVCHVGSQKGVAGLREGSGSYTPVIK
jgi:hypothetical protein